MKPFPDRAGVIVVYSGADIPRLRRLLIQEGMRACKLSAMSLYKTRKHLDLSDLRDELLNFDYVIVESGFFIGKRKFDLTESEIGDFYAFYTSLFDALGDVVTAWGVIDALDGEQWTVNDVLFHAESLMEAHPHARIMPTIFSFMTRQDVDRNPVYARAEICAVAKSDRHHSRMLTTVNDMRSTGILIHGYGLAGLSDLHHLGLFSADSFSWANGGRYGTTFEFRHGAIHSYNARDKAAVRMRLLPEAEASGVSREIIEKDFYGKPVSGIEADEIDRFNLLQWKKYEDYLFRMRKE